VDNIRNCSNVGLDARRAGLVNLVGRCSRSSSSSLGRCGAAVERRGHAGAGAVRPRNYRTRAEDAEKKNLRL